MDLRTMEYFLVVVEEGSISRGAQRLNMSQPPLTVRLKALEAELGVPLLSRHGRGVEPTAAGRMFAERARRLLVELQSTGDAVRSVGQGMSGSLTIGVGHSVAPSLLARLLRVFRAEAPEVGITLSEGDEAPVRGRVDDGELDCALLHAAPPDASHGRPASIESAIALREPLVVVVREDVPEARAERVDLVALTVGDLVAPTGATATALLQHSRALWVAAGGDPGRIRETGSTGTALALVAAGVGSTILPLSATVALIPGLTARPLLQHHPALELSVLWRADRRSPVLHRFLRIALATPEPDVLGPEHARHDHGTAPALA